MSEELDSESALDFSSSQGDLNDVVDYWEKLMTEHGQSGSILFDILCDDNVSVDSLRDFINRYCTHLDLSILRCNEEEGGITLLMMICSCLTFPSYRDDDENDDEDNTDYDEDDSVDSVRLEKMMLLLDEYNVDVNVKDKVRTWVIII